MNEKFQLRELEEKCSDDGLDIFIHEYDNYNETIKRLTLCWAYEEDNNPWRDPWYPPSAIEIVWQLRAAEALSFENYPYRCFPSNETTVGIGNLSKTLKNLSLINCCSLRELPSGVGLLVNLTNLTLHALLFLTHLPPEIGNLACIETLKIDSVTALECLPPEIGNLKNLHDLELVNTLYLQSIPKEIGNLTCLKTIKIDRNLSLQSIPPEITNLRNLHHLEWSKAEYLPQEIYRLESLQELKINCCKNSTQILPEIGNLKNLVKLEISNVPTLEVLPKEIGNLDQLEILMIMDCGCLAHSPPDIGNMKRLRILEISPCAYVEAVAPMIGNIHSLQEVSLCGRNCFEYFLQEMGSWKALGKLSISAGKRNFGGRVNDFLLQRNQFGTLQEISIACSNDIVCLPPEIGKMVYLHKLEITNQGSLECLPPEICHLENLQELKIDSCKSFRSLPEEIGNLRCLRELHIEGYPMNFHSIPIEMKNLESLKKLHIVRYSGCFHRLSQVIHYLQNSLEQLYIDYFYDPKQTDLFMPLTRAAIVFNMTLEELSFEHLVDADNYHDFLHSATTESSMLPLSSLLPQSIQRIEFLCFHISPDEINQNVVLEFLQKYPKLGKIEYNYYQNLQYFTGDTLHMMYFNRFGRSLQDKAIISSDGILPTRLAGGLWPMVLEEAQTRIQKDVERECDKMFSPRMISTSVIFSIIREVALPLLLDG